LFSINSQTIREKIPRDRVVRLGRNGNVHGIDLPDKLPIIGADTAMIFAGDGTAACVIDIRNADNGTHIDGPIFLQMVGAEMTDPYNPDLDGIHGLPSAAVTYGDTSCSLANIPRGQKYSETRTRSD